MSLDRFAPFLFVTIWATGFVVARLVAPDAEPLTFLVARHSLAIVAFGVIALASRATWPTEAREWWSGLVAGMLLHGIYQGGVFWSIKHGLPTGIAALIAGLQPVLTALLVGPLLGEVVSGRRWLGIGIGLVGAVLVILPKVGGQEGYSPWALAAACAAVLSITLGTIWQKRSSASADLRTNAVAQYVGAIAVTLPAALLLEEGRIEPTPALLIGLAWAVVGLSIGAVLLLLFLIRRGAVAGVAALFYLVPPVSALMAYFLFSETLSSFQVAGMGLAAAGVAVASCND
jgi:drug/metabolite transporter (DMT)-like permease